MNGTQVTDIRVFHAKTLVALNYPHLTPPDVNANRSLCSLTGPIPPCENQECLVHHGAHGMRTNYPTGQIHGIMRGVYRPVAIPATWPGRHM